MKDLLEIFERRGVAYAVVGGYAVNYYGYSRATQDFDLLVYPSTDNAGRVVAALDDFGFGDAGIPRDYFEKAGSAIHLGVEPNRIDLLTCLEGVSNEKIFADLTTGILGEMKVKIISFDDLVRAKRSSERPRDQADAAELQSLAERRIP